MSSNQKTQEITVCAFIHKGGKLFVAKRAETKKFLPGIFELPGGRVDFGETMEDGLKREIKEEFNFKIKIGEPFYVFTYVSRNDTRHSIEVVYFATMDNPDKKITLDANDHSEYRWITKEEISAILGKDDPEGEAAKKGFDILRDKSDSN